MIYFEEAGDLEELACDKVTELVTVSEALFGELMEKASFSYVNRSFQGQNERFGLTPCQH